MLNGRGWAVREGDWVLLSRPGSLGFTTEFIHGAWVNFEELNVAHSDYTDRGRLKPDAPQGQLYNLAADPGQTTNLYRQHPDRIARLTRLLDAIESDGRSRPPTNR